MEIHAESLENLLASLREHASPLPPIPALPALHRGEVIEIQGPASSGKTHLLYHVLLACLAPASHIAAVVYDTDAAFDIQRFRHLLFSRVSRLSRDPDDIVQSALARLHVFRPTSVVQLATSIASLPEYHASHMPNQEIAILAVDSISSFYWTDRFSAEQLRRVPMVPSLHHVLNALQSAQRSHRPLVVLTNWELNPASSYPGSLYRQHLHPFPVVQAEDTISPLGAKAPANTDHASSSPFPLAHHIALSSPSSDPFPPAAPLRDLSHGSAAIDGERVLCLTRSSGARDAARFTFRITRDDTLVHPETVDRSDTVTQRSMLGE